MLAEFFFAFLRIGMKSWSIKAQKRMSLISSHLDRTSLIYKGFIAFDEGECMLIVSFYGNHSGGFYGPVPRDSIVISGIRRHFGLADWLADWLAGYVAQIASIPCTNVFLA